MKSHLEIVPEQAYSLGEAARYLGVHRCTIYDYIKHPDHPLQFMENPRNKRLLFYGSDLIAYKAAEYHKLGRKRKD